MSKKLYYLVIDVEATCDDTGAVPRDGMEIIEIGAVLVDAKTLEAVDDTSIIIRPERHPQLTPFCLQLTSITQEMVDGGCSFADAMVALKSFIGNRDVFFCSWGAFDRKQFLQDAKYHGVALPFPTHSHINLKRKFSRQLNTKRRFGVAQALKKAGFEFVGTPHRGIDDARNITRLLPFCLRPGRLFGPQTPDERVIYAEEAFLVDVQEHICEVMAEQGISRKELARRLDVGVEHIRGILSGEKNLSVKMLARVFFFLGHECRLETRVEDGQ